MPQLEEDWNDDCDWEPSTLAHVGTQVDGTATEEPSSRLFAEVSTQTNIQDSLRTVTTQTVERITKVTRTTQTVEQPDLHFKSVSVFSSQKERYEYWPQRREQLNHELSVAKLEIDNMLSDLVAQIDSLTQSAT